VNNKSIFCPYPFSHVNVRTNGDLEVCCDHQSTNTEKININQSSVDEWINSNYRREVQDYFRRNERHPGCERCWRREDQNTGSLRTAIQKEYRILGVSDTSHDKLVSVEAQVGNLCNLKCLMCDETQSSVILQENIRLGINQVDQKEFTWLETGYQNLEELINQDLKVLNFRGGEPLYNKKIKNFLEKFPKDRANKVLLHLITNATVWDNSWEEILSKFKLVRMMLSIDAVSDCYEYIRFPASWENVNSNVQSIIKLPNVKPIVHCTVQNLNILYLDDLIKWCVDHGIYIEFNMLVYPQHLRPTNLPKRSIEHALNKLKAVESICTPNLVDSNLSSILNILQQSLDLDSDTALWQEFENKVTMRDQIRGNSYKNILTDN